MIATKEENKKVEERIKVTESEKVFGGTKKQYSIYIIIDILLNALTFSLFFYLSWMFPQEEYGKLNALLSFLALTYVLGLSYQMYVAKVVNTQESRIENIIQSAKKLVLFLVVPFLLSIPLLSNFLQSSLLSVGILGLIITTSLFLCIEKGLFQGQERFIHLSISLSIDIGIKTLVVVPLLFITSSIPLVLLSTLLGHIGSYLFCRIINKPYYDRKQDSQTTSLCSIYISIWSIFTAQFFFYFFTSIDTVIVNHFLSEKAGIYSITLKLGQLYLIFGTTLLFLVFPKMIRHRDDFAKLKRVAFQYITVVLFIGCILSVIYYFWFAKWILLLFPKDYIDVQSYLGFSNFIYTFLLISIILTHLLIAYDNKDYIKIFASSAVIYIVLTIFFHQTFLHLMFIQLFTYLLMAILLLYHFIKLDRKEAKLQ